MLTEFFVEEFQGVLVSDFYSAYNSVEGSKFQKCLVHLLRELKNVRQYKDISEDWSEFEKKLKRLIRDGIRLWRDKKPKITGEQYVHLRSLLEKRMDELLAVEWINPNVKRLQRRLLKYRNHLFTFLYNDAVPFDNNFAERAIRPAVIQRKNSGGNQSIDSAETQSILMSARGRYIPSNNSSAWRTPGSDGYFRLANVGADRRTSPSFRRACCGIPRQLR